MSDVQQQLDSQADTWILVTLPVILAIGGLVAIYVLWPTGRGFLRWCFQWTKRRELGDLTPVVKYQFDECTTTVHQERRDVRGDAVIGWVVVDEWADGTSSWRRFRTLEAADNYAADDGFMREW